MLGCPSSEDALVANRGLGWDPLPKMVMSRSWLSLGFGVDPNDATIVSGNIGLWWIQEIQFFGSYRREPYPKYEIHVNTWWTWNVWWYFPSGNDNNEKNNNTEPVCVCVCVSSTSPSFCKYIPSFQIGPKLTEQGSKPLCHSTIASWSLNQPVWNICAGQIGSNFRGVNKKTLSCHHLDIDWFIGILTRVLL